MSSRWTSYALGLLVFGTPASARGAGTPAPVEAQQADAGLEGQDLAHPPPGTPQDQALWRSGLEVTQAVQIERARATRLQAVLLNLRYTDRLQALAGRGGEPGEKGAALKSRLGDAHAQQFWALTARGPIDTYRVCGYPAMEFGSMLLYARADPADLAKHRAMLVGCVEQAQTSLGAMRTSNDALEAAMKAADAVLVPAGLGPPTGVIAHQPAPAAAHPPAATPATPSSTERDGGPEKAAAPGKREDGGGARRGTSGP